MQDFHFVERTIGASPADQLLILLHGYGAHENDLIDIANALPGSFKVLSLRAPLALPWGGYAWYPISPSGSGFTSDTGAAIETLENLESAIPKWCHDKEIELGRITLLGFSQGSILSQALMFRKPEWFETVIGLSGYLNKELLPETTPEAIRSCRIYLTHGTQDEVIPVEWARQSSKAYESMKIAHSYREYPIGHGIHPQGLQDLANWMELGGKAPH